MKIITVSVKNVITVLIMIVLFAVTGFVLFNINSREEKVIETLAVPTANKIILIDPGHGGVDAGASTGDLKEKDINLDIALKLQQLVEQSGGIAVLTRNEDVSTADKNRDKTLTQKKSDLMERKSAIEKYNADIFISIHMNKFSDEKYSGAQVFYPTGAESKRLAEIMQKSLKEVLDKSNNRKEEENNKIYVIKDNKVPSVLIECGFLSNKKETEKFKSESYRQKTAWAIYMGLNNFFNYIEKNSGK